jgi:hypothetical protein
MIPSLGVIATCAEILFSLLLLVGWHTRAATLLSGLLLLTFGVAVTLALEVKAPLNFAVLTGIGGPYFLQIAKASHSAWMTCCPVEPFIGLPNVITNDDFLSRNPPSGNCWSAIARRKSTIGHRLWIGYRQGTEKITFGD